MTLKFQCPHCFAAIEADASRGGQPMTCAACRRIVHAPRPEAPAHAAARRCPRCTAELAPTATVCLRCLTSLATGRKLPLRERLPYYSWRAWFGLLLGGVAALLLVGAGVQLWRLTRAHPSPPPSTAPAPTFRTQAHALLFAADDSDRQAALAALAGVEAQASDDVAAALAEACAAPAPIEANMRAAIDLLVRHRSGRDSARRQWLDAVRAAEKAPGVAAAALRARGILGDRDALDALIAGWCNALERAHFFERLASAASADAAAARAAAQRETRSAAFLADGLRVLAAEHELDVFERVGLRYWRSWEWLGQDGGERFADAMFDLARPLDRSLTFDPNDIRGPRDAFWRVAERGSPAARAAAAAALGRVPQYRTLAQHVSENLAHALTGADAAGQQRMIWAIGKLRGKAFGPHPAVHPLSVGPQEAAAAQAWVGSTAPIVHARYAGPPRLRYVVRRVID